MELVVMADIPGDPGDRPVGLDQHHLGGFHPEGLDVIYRGDAHDIFKQGMKPGG